MFTGFLLLAAGAIVHANGFAGVFLFDDIPSILADGRLNSFTPIEPWLRSSRPVVNLSLVLSYKLSGYQTWGYHALNLAVHLAAGLLLFGIIRLTIPLARPDRHGRDADTWFAAVVALLWIVHPLQTQSVTYVIQRSESMMGMFYLLTLYCLLRGYAAECVPESTPPRATVRRRIDPALPWFCAAVLACLAGMASKPVMVTAPVAILLFDRLFLAHRFRNIPAKRWALHGALAATWLVLWWTGTFGGVLSPRSTPQEDPSVGFGIEGIGPLQYALTQSAVLLHYLRLAVWPVGQCLDYGWPPVERPDAAIIPTLALLVLLAASLAALRKHRGLGFAGLWFFLVLAPTSSFVPIRDPAFEHRMYLPLAGVLVVIVAVGRSLLAALARRLSWPPPFVKSCAAAAILAVATTLGYLTHRRNALYADPVSIWADAVRQAPRNPRAHNALGWALLLKGETDDAIRAFRAAVSVAPRFAPAYVNMGIALLRRGDYDDAIAATTRGVELDPDGFGAEAHLNLAKAHLLKKDHAAAILAYQSALQVAPEECGPQVYLSLGHAQLTLDRVDEAIDSFRHAIRLDSRQAVAHYNLAEALKRKGDAHSARASYRQAIELDPAYFDALAGMAMLLTREEKDPDALNYYRRALEREPAMGREDLRAETHYGMGLSLLNLGDRASATTAFRAALRLKPEHAGAKSGLQIATTP